MLRTVPGSRTLSDKVWDSHVVVSGAGGEPDLVYIDLHLVHEVTSAQAFDGVRMAGRTVRRPDLTLATADHNIPTVAGPMIDLISARQIEALAKNCAEFAIPILPVGHPMAGIVHVIAPELGFTLPGMTVVCGDSHTATHGAFGALAWGIGTSEVEHVLVTQTLPLARPRRMEVRVDGTLRASATAKDVILNVIGQIGTGGGAGYVIEYRGQAIRELSMEGRMTVCNMSIEAGARAGMVAPDDTTFAYLERRPYAPRGREFEQALDDWRNLVTDEDAVFDRTVVIDATRVSPHVTWGTTPAQVIPLDNQVPDPASFADKVEAAAATRAQAYMDVRPGTSLRDLPIDVVFIGSCTNSRIEDLRAVAEVVRGRKVAVGVEALVVPGSMQVRTQAEAEGLDRILTDAGLLWREPGCSMCLGMNPDKLTPGQRAVSTSNRNFEGRQGPGGRTHLASPAIAAATAIAGHLAEPEDLG